MDTRKILGDLFRQLPGEQKEVYLPISGLGFHADAQRKINENESSSFKEDDFTMVAAYFYMREHFGRGVYAQIIAGQHELPEFRDGFFVLKQMRVGLFVQVGYDYVRFPVPEAVLVI